MNTITQDTLRRLGFKAHVHTDGTPTVWKHRDYEVHLTEGRPEHGDAGVWFLWDKANDPLGPVGDLCTVDQLLEYRKPDMPKKDPTNLSEEFSDADRTESEKAKWKDRPDRVFKFFAYEHLQNGDARSMSKKFHEMAEQICMHCEPGPERTVALRKLLESKDAAVRSIIHPGG